MTRPRLGRACEAGSLLMSDQPRGVALRRGENAAMVKTIKTGLTSLCRASALSRVWEQCVRSCWFSHAEHYGAHARGFLI